MATGQEQHIIPSLRLLRTEGIGAVTYRRLVQRYGSPQAALEQWHQIGGKAGIAARPFPREAAEQEYHAVQRLGGWWLHEQDADYPALLQETPDAPPLLTALGQRQLLQKPLLAIVGSRNASAVAQRFTRKLAEDMGRCGYGVVSGLARGIDAAAHNGALPYGTLGVIATGIDLQYPPDNHKLYSQMREEGLILTEQPLGTEPHPRAFPRRNRMVAGLARATVVVEATLQSGSLITARLAADYGRDVFAVPGHPMDVRAKGCNRLLKDGAMLLEGIEDILAAYGRGDEPSAQQAGLFATALQTPPPAAKGSDMVASAETTLQRKLLQHLSTQPIEVDELCRLCDTSANQLLTVLLELELSGQVERLPGNRLARTG